jgi:aminotransferase EvaB
MIKVFDYLASLEAIEQEVLDAVQRVLRSGQLILGPETAAFEEEFASFVGARHCVGVSSGTTALHLALMALGIGPGDEVLTVSNTCSPTVAAIRLVGATPVFVDVRRDDLMLDSEHLAAKITLRTRCIIPVHLWGNSAAIDTVRDVGRAHGLRIIEDCAQAQGTLYGGTHVGTFGDVGCFSFYPTKNIGAFGDAGAVVCQDPELAERLRAQRMYGYRGSAVSEIEGMNARIAEIQAAILRIKLRLYPEWLRRRREIAALYTAGIDHPAIQPPRWDSRVEPSFHQYVIRCEDRDAVAAALDGADIGYGIHYPVPVHKMPAYRSTDVSLPVTEMAAREILSLPVHEALVLEEASRVIECLNAI